MQVNQQIALVAGYTSEMGTKSTVAGIFRNGNWLYPLNSVTHRWAYQRALNQVSRPFVHPYDSNFTGWGRRAWRQALGKWFFLYYRVPTDRSAAAHYIQFARKRAFNVDEQRPPSVYLNWYANQLLPLNTLKDLEKKRAVTDWLNHTRLENVPSNMNYDPMIPWLAPYLEEARFQIQEEEELIDYHPWTRRLFVGGYTGTGTRDRFRAASACMFG